VARLLESLSVITHGNILFVQTQGAYLSQRGETVRVRVQDEVKLTVPAHHLEGIVCFGRVTVSPALIAMCSERNLSIAYFSEHGRFVARLQGPVSGNVLLRRQQYRRADEPASCLRVARCIVAAKIQNCRAMILRAARETGVEDRALGLRRLADRLSNTLCDVAKAPSVDVVRGFEGDAARVYFDHFNLFLRQQTDAFRMTTRSRRPPLDPLNALLSFVYAILTNDMVSALEGVGLDPAVGFLHVDRPGRPSLALDLVEEFRTLVADRLVVSLINLKQVQADGFETQPGGAVLMKDTARRTVLSALTQRKREEVTHPLSGQKVCIGLLPHVQARLMARHLRGDIEDYPALVLK
jgi:CRISPR-associated protein Cas1